MLKGTYNDAAGSATLNVPAFYGAGFQPGEAVTIEMVVGDVKIVGIGPGEDVGISYATANKFGAFKTGISLFAYLTFILRGDTSDYIAKGLLAALATIKDPMPGGLYTVKATGLESGRVASVVMELVAPAPKVTIISPKAGDVVKGTEVTVTMDATGTLITRPDGSKDPGKTHFVLALDAALPAGTGPVPIQPPYVHTPANSYTFTGVTPGEHTLIVSVHYGDHSPVQPPAQATVKFKTE